MANEFLTKRVKKFTYDVAVSGGTKGTSIDIGGLPDNALITGGNLVTKTDFVGNTTTMSIGYTGATAAFMAATTATTMDANEIIPLLPGIPTLGSDASTLTTGTVATLQAAIMASQILLTDPKRVLITLSNDNDLTAGKLVFYLEYVIMN